MHCLAEVQECLSYLPNNEAPLRLVMHARRVISDFDPAKLLQEDLRTFLDELQIHLAYVHDAIREV